MSKYTIICLNPPDLFYIEGFDDEPSTPEGWNLGDSGLIAGNFLTSLIKINFWEYYT